ncbi:MAG: nickel-dependent lactate racemase, partial [Chitinivibrionales bacterium]|nr:nickel-dependent lactate racemase [Chitinivibrionales bacterium]
MKIKMDFGKQGLSADLKAADFTILELAEAPKLADAARSIAEALKQPIGCAAFQSLARNKKRACIVVSDKTRPVPNKIILPPLLEILDAEGVSTTILIACGMHTPTTGCDLEEILGQSIIDRYTIINHDGGDVSALVNLGASSHGVDVLVNRYYMEADLKILTGFIEPHFMAGFSGGRKAICPGIMGEQTMKFAHSPTVLESPNAMSGVLANNPVHAFFLEAAGMAGCDFIVNVTLNREKQITGVFCGNMEQAHAAGAAFCLQHSRATIKKAADIVITSNGGYPLDQDFYQTVKGMVSCLDVLKQGGTIIIASECCRGVGSDHFKKLLFEMTDY